MQIFVVGWDGRTHTYDVQPTDTVARLKKFIQDTEGVQPGVNRLLCSGKQLEDERTLQDCEINHDSTILSMGRLGVAEIQDSFSDAQPSHLSVTAPVNCEISVTLDTDSCFMDFSIAVQKIHRVCRRFEEGDLVEGGTTTTYFSQRYQRLKFIPEKHLDADQDYQVLVRTKNELEVVYRWSIRTASTVKVVIDVPQSLMFRDSDLCHMHKFLALYKTRNCDRNQNVELSTSFHYFEALSNMTLEVSLQADFWQLKQQIVRKRRSEIQAIVADGYDDVIFDTFDVNDFVIENENDIIMMTRDKVTDHGTDFYLVPYGQRDSGSGWWVHIRSNRCEAIQSYSIAPYRTVGQIKKKYSEDMEVPLGELAVFYEGNELYNDMYWTEIEKNGVEHSDEFWISVVLIRLIFIVNMAFLNFCMMKL